MVQGNITRLETKIAKLEEKQTLTEKEQTTVSKMVKKLEALSTEFKMYHGAILDQIEDDNKLAKEQAVLDDDEDVTECLQDLVNTAEPVMPHASDMGDHRPVGRSITEVEPVSRKLSQVHNSLTTVKIVVKVKETDMCLLEGSEEKLKSIDTDLQGIMCDMLLIDKYERLAGRAGGLEEA